MNIALQLALFDVRISIPIETHNRYYRSPGITIDIRYHATKFYYRDQKQAQ